jgi:hypothetical protein
MSNGTITVQYEVPEQLIRDVIITACEGGIGYWSQLYDYDGPAIDENAEGSLPLRIRVIEEEGFTDESTVYGPWRDFDIDHVVKGFGILFEKYPQSIATRNLMGALANYDSGNYDFDAGDADAVVQCGLLGDIIYG